MRLNSTGENVRALQENLNELSYRLEADGYFGPKTENAVIHFQKAHRLVADGIVGPKTIARLTSLADPGFLSQQDIEAAAEKLSVPVPAIMAFNEVESRGQGFIAEGQPAILFERHIMRRRLIQRKTFAIEDIEERHPDIVNRRPGGYRGGNHEYARLEKAKSIDVESALESTSWGLFQIMGIHAERLGYGSVGDFVAAMKESESKQLDALVRFIQADHCLLRAIQKRQWDKVARIYNGPGYAKNGYDVKLQQAYERYSALYDEAETTKEVRQA